MDRSDQEAAYQQSSHALCCSFSPGVSHETDLESEFCSFIVFFDRFCRFVMATSVRRSIKVMKPSASIQEANSVHLCHFWFCFSIDRIRSIHERKKNETNIFPIRTNHFSSTRFLLLYYGSLQICEQQSVFLLVNVSVQRRNKGADDVIFAKGFGKIIVTQESK